MAKATLADKAKFFPNVLADPGFKNEGILFGEDPALVRNCKWVVVDPGRHALYIWQKALPTEDFVSAAVQLNASVFTNGPFFIYESYKVELGNLVLTGTNPGISYGQYLGHGYAREYGTQVLDSVAPGTNLLRLVQPRDVQDVAMLGKTVAVATGKTALNLLGDTWKAVTRKKAALFGEPPPAITPPRLESDQVKNEWKKTGKEFLAARPCGYIVGNKNSIRWDTSAKHLAYFGRAAATDFGSYTVGDGDPSGMAEAIGAVIRAVKEYAVVPDESAIGSNQYFYWGLAPLDPEAPRFKESGLKEALGAYSQTNPPRGLIFGIFYQGPSHAQLMVDAGVKDAVRIDGSDSVIFGHHKTLLWGDAMIQYKRVAQCWGYAFYPR